MKPLQPVSRKKRLQKDRKDGSAHSILEAVEERIALSGTTALNLPGMPREFTKAGDYFYYAVDPKRDGYLTYDEFYRWDAKNNAIDLIRKDGGERFGATQFWLKAQGSKLLITESQSRGRTTYWQLDNGDKLAHKLGEEYEPATVLPDTRVAGISYPFSSKTLGLPKSSNRPLAFRVGKRQLLYFGLVPNAPETRLKYLHVTDGTADGTRMLALPPGAKPIATDGKRALVVGNGTLYITDGSDKGTLEIKLFYRDLQEWRSATAFASQSLIVHFTKDSFYLTGNVSKQFDPEGINGYRVPDWAGGTSGGTNLGGGNSSTLRINRLTGNAAEITDLSATDFLEAGGVTYFRGGTTTDGSFNDSYYSGSLYLAGSSREQTLKLDEIFGSPYLDQERVLYISDPYSQQISTPAPASRLFGRIFFDQNQNGKFDANDVPRDQVQVWVDLNSDGLHQDSEPFTKSDYYGYYQLDVSGKAVGRQFPIGVDAGFAQVQRTTGENVKFRNWTARKADIGIYHPDDRVFVDVQVMALRSYGKTKPVVGTRVWIDLNRDGKRGSSEPTAFTNNGGIAEFEGLTSGTYLFRTTQPGDNIELWDRYYDRAVTQEMIMRSDVFGREHVYWIWARKSDVP